MTIAAQTMMFHAILLSVITLYVFGEAMILLGHFIGSKP